MKKFIPSLLLALAAVPQAFGCGCPKTCASGVTTYYAAGGIQQFNFDALDARTAAYSLPQAPTMAYQAGGGGLYSACGFVFGGEGYYLKATGTPSVGENSGLKTEINGGYGTLYLGYKVVRSYRFSMYPLMGIGAGGLGLSVQPTRNIASSDPVIQALSKGESIGMGAMIYQAAIGIHVRPFKSPMILTMRTGYNYTRKAILHAEDNYISTNPAVRFGGFFTNVGVGINLTK